MKKIENKATLRAEGVLHTTADILRALSGSNGFKNQGANFKKVVKGIVEGYSIIDILKDPVGTIGVAANQKRFFEEFVRNHKLSSRIYKPTRRSVHIPFASITKMEVKDGKVYSVIDYSDAFNYKVISESALTEVFAGAETEIKYYRNGKFAFSRKLLPMHHLFIVDLYLDLPENEDDWDEDQRYMAKLREHVVREGFYYYDANGEERHAKLLMRSPSQKRTLKAIYIDCDFMSPIQALKVLGFDLTFNAKINSDGHFVVQIDKMFARPGLSLTNTVASKVVKLGNEIEVINDKEYRIVGGTHTMRVIEDRKVKITSGKYRMFNKETQKLEEFDASEHPLTLTAADGALFCDEEMYYTLAAEFGEKCDAWQVRITPFGKGLMVFVPGLRRFYGDHIVALQSAIKGDYRNLFKANPDFIPELRVAIFNSNINAVKQYTDMPYQFIHGSSLTVNELWTLLSPHLEEIKQSFKDPNIMKKYLGLDKHIDIDLLSDEDQHTNVERTLVSTLATFLHYVEWSYDDPQMKKLALEFIRNKIKDWKTGNVPVEGHYRYMIQDPYAVLEAGTKYEVRDDEGNLLIVQKPYHIKPQHCFVASRHKDKTPLYIAVGRNPMVSKGEWQVLRNSGPKHYVRARKKGAFRNLCVMSVHDMATFAMGGADNDGDTCLTVTSEIVIQSLMKKNTSPIMDISFVRKNGEVEVIGDGCPYPGQMVGIYQIPRDMIIKQDNYKVVFAPHQATDELYEEIYKLNLDYEVRTLKPNKIGYVTNIATILADAIRGYGYCIALGIDVEGNKLSDKRKEEYLNRINQYEEYIGILRLIQGWEIDAAKHGGAYQEAMKETLSFLDNPPEELSYFSKSLGKLVWRQPDWLAERKGKTGHDLGSVLSRIRKRVLDYEQELNNELDKMMQDVQQNSLLTKLASAFNDLDLAYFNHLVNEVKRVKTQFGMSVRSLKVHKDIHINKLVASNYPKDYIELKIEKIQEIYNEQLNKISDEARYAIHQIMLKYPAHHVGYAAYYITYANRKKNASLSFPWTIAREAFLQTLLYADNKEVQDSVRIGDVFARNIKLAACIPSEVQAAVGMEKVLELLKTRTIGLLAAGDVYKLYIGGKEFGYLYNSKTNELLLGHDKYVARIESAEFNGKHTVMLTANVVKA